MRYNCDADVALRLGDTFIKYHGKCYLAKTLGSGNKIVLYSAKDEFQSGQHTVDANSPEVDITSLEVGFQQYVPGKVLYVCRAPFRKQKQGVGYDNLICRGLKDDQFQNLNPSFLYSKSFMKMLDNQYPTYQEAHESLTKSACELAFSRKLALVVPGGSVNSVHLYLNIEKIAEKKKHETHWFLNADYNNTTVAAYLKSKGVPLY